MVIDAKDAAGQPVFTLGGLSETQLGNYTMPTEQIAALSEHDLKIQAENNFDEKGQLARYDLAIQDNYYYINFLFPVGERATDARWVGSWSYKTTSGQTNFVKYKKYTQKEVNPFAADPAVTPERNVPDTHGNGYQ